MGITSSLLWRTRLSYHSHGRFREIQTNLRGRYLVVCSRATPSRGPRWFILSSSFKFWLGVRLFYLLTVVLGLAGLTLDTVLIFCAFGRFCLGLRSLPWGVLRLREIKVLNDRGI